MWILAVTLCQAALAAPIGSPQWPTSWGKFRVQTGLTGERTPTETQLKWRTGALRFDLGLQDNLGVWVEGAHTGGRGQPNERVGGNTAGGGLRSSVWVTERFGLGLQGRTLYQESWTLGAAGGIKARGRTLRVEGTPTVLVGDSSAQAWAGVSLASTRTTDLLSAESAASWTRPGYRGWNLGAEVRSGNLRGIGSLKELRSFVGVELQWATERSCGIWSGIAF
jgi:hypothetical protein